METTSLPLPTEVLAAFCRRHHVRRLALYGSALRGELRPESDLDLLVEFEEGHTPGLLGLATMEAELADRLGRPVDLRTPEDLSPHFRDEVTAAAAVQYVAEG